MTARALTERGPAACKLAGRAFVMGFSGAAMPGPLLVACIWFAAGPLGVWSGAALMLGHLLIEVLVVIALSLGLAKLLQRPDSLLARVIGVAGGLMLFWMGGDMLASLPHLSLRSVIGAQQHFHAVTTGFLLSLVNPGFWVWWASIGLGQFAEAVREHGKPGVAVFYVGHYASDIVWYTLISLAVASGRGLLTDGVYRGLIGFLAVCLIVFGARFIWGAARSKAKTQSESAA